MPESPSSDRSPEARGCHGSGRRFLGSSLEDLERYVLTPEAGARSLEYWEQVRDFAVGGMQSHDLSCETRLRWGRLALSAISRKERSRTPQQAMAESAHVRAYMIREFGVSTADAARDLPALCSEILRNVGVSPEAGARLAEGWRSASRDQMLHLRRIKNMLTPLLPLRALLEGDDRAFRETRAWLELVPRLP
ncbi:hypothetical protein OHA27_24465 [Streptomyces sp. NBC_01619]|uniref:hypothetical protein n=1 Tax=unclassified Streptomyces TaxID=2593676 RepID=UPI0022583F48|nr:MULTISPECIES: hypothetical protein [unclassified Streptomyces]MCX4513418.1 hypothetical protein [Streptomyces sp. NBC_01619]